MDVRFEKTVTLIRENSELLHSSMESVTKQKFIGEDEVYTPHEKINERKDGSIVISRVNTAMTARFPRESSYSMKALFFPQRSGRALKTATAAGKGEIPIPEEWVTSSIRPISEYSASTLRVYLPEKTSSQSTWLRQ